MKELESADLRSKQEHEARMAEIRAQQELARQQVAQNTARYVEERVQPPQTSEGPGFLASVATGTATGALGGAAVGGVGAIPGAIGGAALGLGS